MKYNFDEVVDRKGTYSCKLDQMPEGAPSDALSVWVADMDFACAEPIIRALHERIDRKIFGYTIYDNEDLKHAVTGWFRRRYGWEVAKEDVFFSPGVVPALAFLLQALTSEGDGIIIQRPVYYPFTNKINGNNRKIFNSSLIYENGDYRMDYEDLEKKFADEAVKGMILCSPHNPVGRVWTVEELGRLVEIAKKYGKWIISDEIHYDIVYPGYRHLSILNVDEDAVMITAPSKTFNIAGLKSSIIIIKNRELREKVGNFAASMHLYINLFAYRATETAYEKGGPWVDEMMAYLEENARFVVGYITKYLPKVKVAMPESTYLMWMDFSGCRFTQEELFLKMRDEAKVALNFGAEYGSGYEQFVRLNIACPRRYLEEGMEHIRNSLANK